MQCSVFESQLNIYKIYTINWICYFTKVLMGNCRKSGKIEHLIIYCLFENVCSKSWGSLPPVCQWGNPSVARRQVSACLVEIGSIANHIRKSQDRPVLSKKKKLQNTFQTHCVQERNHTPIMKKLCLNSSTIYPFY